MFGPSDKPDAADEDLAADDVGGRLVASCPPQVWQWIRLAGIHLVCQVAETGGLTAVNRLLADHGCGWACLPPEPRQQPP